MEVVGAIIGFVLVSIIILMLVAPLYVPKGLFVNKPKQDGPSGIHFFTFIEPGKVKIIVRGERVIRMVMHTSGKKFARDGEREGEGFWEIMSGDSEHPLTDINILLRPWAYFVFNLTGAVFTGIYPFQRVREYRLERTKISRKEAGERKVNIGTNEESNIKLHVEEDFSDHYRLRTFLYPMNIKGAESKDKIPLDILGVAEMQVVNPHKSAFGTDRWDHAVVNMVTDAINSTTKTLTLDQALTADNLEGTRVISGAVMSIQTDTTECGIEITGFRVLEINPVLTPDGLTAIQAEALATQQGKATVIDGKARGEANSALRRAAGTGAAAIETIKSEAMVRAADAASKNGGSVILMANGGNQTDPTQTAILAELKRIARKPTEAPKEE